MEKAMIEWLEAAIERYETFNNWERTDGLVYHTDCLDDLVEFLKNGEEQCKSLT